jgi:hemoglobin
MYYRGREMEICHRGMGISESDWKTFLSHAAATLAKFKVPEDEQLEIVRVRAKSQAEIVEVVQLNTTSQLG